MTPWHTGRERYDTVVLIQHSAHVLHGVAHLRVLALLLLGPTMRHSAGGPVQLAVELALQVEREAPQSRSATMNNKDAGDVAVAGVNPLHFQMQQALVAVASEHRVCGGSLERTRHSVSQWLRRACAGILAHGQRQS